MSIHERRYDVHHPFSPTGFSESVPTSRSVLPEKPNVLAAAEVVINAHGRPRSFRRSFQSSLVESKEPAARHVEETAIQTPTGEIPQQVSKDADNSSSLQVEPVSDPLSCFRPERVPSIASTPFFAR